MGQKHATTTSKSADVEQLDKEINKQLTEQKEKESTEIKILFFGLSGSGGSTIMSKIKEYTQMMQQNSTYDAKASFREVIQFHALRCVQQIIHASALLDMPLITARDKVQKEAVARTIEAIKTTHFCFNQTTLTPEIGKSMSVIWQLQGAKQIYDRRDDEKLANLGDIKTANYFLENIDRISSASYTPTDQDITFYHENFNQDCRGVEEIAFEFSGQKYRLFNIEGQVGDKRKWLHHFEHVDVVCLLCPIGDYDAPPVAEGRKNIVLESQELFEEIVAKAFKRVPIIALLTKYDLFLAKVLETDLICCFEDYIGGCVEKEAIRFITGKFLKLKSPLRKKKSFVANDHEKLSSLINSAKQQSLHTMNSEEPQEPNIFINFVSSQNNLQEIINNLGGTLKNIQYLKSLSAQSSTHGKSDFSGNGSSTPTSPARKSVSSELSNALFSGLVNKRQSLKKKKT